MNCLQIEARILPDGPAFTVKGRGAWALKELIKAGQQGCTPVDRPAPRWSAYIHRLRHVHDLAIETVHEHHGGPFPGSHGRYILRSTVEILSHSLQESQQAA